LDLAIRIAGRFLSTCANASENPNPQEVKGLFFVQKCKGDQGGYKVKGRERSVENTESMLTKVDNEP